MIECCDFLCPIVSSCALVEKQLKVFPFPVTTSLDIFVVSGCTARDGDGNTNDHLTTQCNNNAHQFEITAIKSTILFIRTRLKY